MKSEFEHLFEIEKKMGFRRIILLIIVRSFTAFSMFARYAETTLASDLTLFLGNLIDMGGSKLLKDLNKSTIKSIIMDDFERFLNKLDDETILKERNALNSFYTNQIKIWHDYNDLASKFIFAVNNLIFPFVSKTSNLNTQTIFFTFCYVILETIIRYKFIMTEKSDCFDDITLLKNKILFNIDEVMKNNNLIVEHETISAHTDAVVSLIEEYVNLVYDNEIFLPADSVVGNYKYDLIEKIFFIISKRFIPFEANLYMSLFYNFPTSLRDILFSTSTLKDSIQTNKVFYKILNIEQKVYNKNTEVDLESPNLFTITNISKSFGDNIIFNNTSLIIPVKKWISFIGNSGSGKSTLIRILLGKETVDSGTVTFLNDALCIYNNNKDYISYVSKNDLFNDSLFKNLTYGVKISRSNINKMNYYLNLFGMNEIPLIENVFNLSTGQQQRTILIRMILHDKPIWVIDETTANIDEENERNILTEIKKIQVEKQKSVIHITHNTANRFVADNVITISDNQLLMS